MLVVQSATSRVFFIYEGVLFSLESLRHAKNDSFCHVSSPAIVHTLTKIHAKSHFGDDIERCFCKQLRHVDLNRRIFVGKHLQIMDQDGGGTVEFLHKGQKRRFVEGGIEKQTTFPVLFGVDKGKETPTHEAGPTKVGKMLTKGGVMYTTRHVLRERQRKPRSGRFVGLSLSSY